MKFNRVSYLALAAALSAVSCSKEAAEPGGYEWEDGNISFLPSLSDAPATRAQDMTLDLLQSFQATCFFDGDPKIENGVVAPHFEDVTFIRHLTPYSELEFVSLPGEEGMSEWPTKRGLLKFYAFSPSCSDMMADNHFFSNCNHDDHFNLINSSVKEEKNISTGYRLANIRVNLDISRQFDFLTAFTSGERWKDFYNVVSLEFKHQMSKIELRAWGDCAGYDIEIAGVRLGNPVIEDSFIFADETDCESAPRWLQSGESVTGKVEYLYAASSGSGDGSEEGGLASGDTVFAINKTKHNSASSAESIMGAGGCAMVIPTVNEKWEGLADPDISAKPYSTGKMYFSILLRATSSGKGHQLYPYEGNPDGMAIVYYAVDQESGLIVSRVYPGKTKDEYFTDSDREHRYEMPEGVVVKEFGWAAVPVEVNWEAGKRYVYTLDYSGGLGWHDPSDPDPGKEISLNGKVLVKVEVKDWPDSENTDVGVPRK